MLGFISKLSSLELELNNDTNSVLQHIIGGNDTNANRSIITVGSETGSNNSNAITKMSSDEMVPQTLINTSYNSNEARINKSISVSDDATKASTTPIITTSTLKNDTINQSNITKANQSSSFLNEMITNNDEQLFVNSTGTATTPSRTATSTLKTGKIIQSGSSESTSSPSSESNTSSQESKSSSSESKSSSSDSKSCACKENRNSITIELPSPIKIAVCVNACTKLFPTGNWSNSYAQHDGNCTCISNSVAP